MDRTRTKAGPVITARKWRSRTGAAVRLIAALGAVSAPPLLLAATVGNPLPAWPVGWTRVVESVQVGLIPSSVWVNVLAVAAWTVWAVLLGMLVIEVVAVARNRPSPMAVPGWIRQAAAALVAATITLAQPAQLALAITGGDTRPVAVAAAPAGYTEVVASLQPQPIGGERLVAVAEGDSWGGFAATVLGDASLGPELRTANLGRQVGHGDTITEATAFVEPGWLLLFPPHLDSRPPATTRARAQPAVTVGDDADRSTWEVEPGDHFWGIATDTITDAWGRAPTDAETAPYWHQVIEANRDTLLPPDDPNVIYPGQQFVLPSAPPDPSAPIADEAAPEPAAPADGDPQDAVSDPPAASSLGPAADQPPSVTDGWIATIEEPAAVPEPAATHTEGPNASEDAPEVDQVVPVDLEVEDRTPLGVPVGLAAGVAASSILAAGVLAMLRWRRRTLLQQRAPGMRLPTPLPEIYNEVAKLDAAAAPEETLDDLAALFASIPLDVHPVLVRVTDDGEVTLLFDDRSGVVPDPPTPWTLADDGMQGPVGWQAHLGDRGPERSFGIPLLVTLGRSGTSTVLANVGAMGTLAVDGSPSEVRRRLRAISLDLATSRISFPVEVAITGDDHLASLDRVRHIDNPADEIQVALREVANVVIDDRIPRLIVCHHDTRPPELPEELIGMVGVLAAEPPASADAWLLDLEDDETGRLRLPDGGTVRLDLPDIDPDLLDHELSRLDQATSLEPDEPADETASDDVDPSGNGLVSHAPPPSTEAAWCEVRLLGPVEVLRDGLRVEGLTPGTLEILVYLATQPHGVTKERLDNVIWAGSAARPGSQRVTSALTKLRKVLGDGPDGEPLVPRRSGDEPIKLSEHLSTDLDRAFAHLAIARDLPAELRTQELTAALELVRGEPLEGRAYSWATDISQRAIVQLQDAALEVARACREAGDLDAADRAIEQGLKLLDPNGWLYLERAELERLRGHPELPPRIFEQYRRKLADDADEIASTVATPPPEIELAFRELMVRA